MACGLRDDEYLRAKVLILLASAAMIQNHHSIP